MQAVLISDGIYTYIMFNYAQDEWNIKPGHRRFGAAGYSDANFTGIIIADNVNFVNLSETHTNSSMFVEVILYSLSFLPFVSFCASSL